MDNISVVCPAKINISLDVVGKREDGYHLLKTIMQNVELFDVITIEKISEGIELKCSKEWIPCDARNTAYKAARLMLEEFKLDSGVKINIEKRIPVAAGLAGGSTDAAGVICGINSLFNLNLSEKEMMDIGVKVGADVPFCIMQRTSLAEGIGEKLTPLTPLNDSWVILAKPPISVSTQYVYRNLKIQEITRHPDTERLMDYINKGDIKAVSKNMVNVLETVTIKDYPVIYEIKKMMMEFHALGSLMSGSGPTVFGIFKDKSTAEGCYNRLKDYLKEVYMVKIYNKEAANS